MIKPETRISLEHSQELVDKAKAAHAALRELASADRRILHTLSQHPHLTKALEELELYQLRIESQHTRIKAIGR